jgi:hypothetical protein
MANGKSIPRQQSEEGFTTDCLEKPAATTKERFLAAAFVIELRRAREAQSTRREET